MMKLRINPLVVTELKEIRRFIAEDNREKTENGHLLSVSIKKNRRNRENSFPFLLFFCYNIRRFTSACRRQEGNQKTGKG